MGVVGGDIREITFNHPDVGSGVLYPKSGEDSEINPGGFRSSDDKNMIDGSGRMIDQMNLERWHVSTTIAWDAKNTKELEKVIKLAASPIEAKWTITHVSGTIWGCTGKPVGDLVGNGNQATFALKISGSGELKPL